MQFPWRSALVIAALAAFAASTGACRSDTAAPTGREAVARAVGDTLPFRARLSGGFAPSKAGPTRAAGDRPLDLSPDARIAIALLEKRATEAPTPAALADLGVGYLIQGDIDRAITTLEDAVAQDAQPSPLSDLSAAYLVKAERTPQRRVEYLARALEAAEKSLKTAPSNDALFNRALARDGLAPYTGSTAPWAEYAAIEKDVAWRNAAAQETSNDSPVDDVRDRWDARRKELATRLTANDVEFARETVRLYPEASIEFFERELLTRPDGLSSAALLASAIHEVTGDPIARDEVIALRSHRPLFTAHQAYAKSVALYGSNDLAGARTSLNDAVRLFSVAKAPYQGWARMRLAEIDWREGALDIALRRLSDVENDARARGYNMLLARALWQSGLAYNRQWRLDAGLAALRESALRFETAGLRESATFSHANIADALRMLGEPHESWAFVGRTLENITHIRSPRRRYLLLYNASLFASREGLNEAALAFQDATVREAEKAGTDVLTEALVQRAQIQVRRGDNARARADLAQASQQSGSTSSDAFRNYINSELAIVRAQISGDSGAVTDLQNAIAFFGKAEPGRLPGLYLQLARTPQARGSRPTAEAALRSGIDALEARQAGLGDEALRISFFDDSWSLFQDMVSLQLAAKNPALAFEYSERSRARSLLAAQQQSQRSRTRSLSEIQSALPSSTVLVYYTTLTDRVLIWTITRSNSKLIEQTVEEPALARLVEQHRESIRDRRELPANNRLYDLLISPVAAALPPSAVVVLVPDGRLQQLPFATLRHPSTRRYLIEDHAILISPSASFFVDARTTSGSTSSAPFSSALLVGNPSAGGARALPGAEAEVAAASKVYARHELLIGRAATKQRFLELAPGFDVVHFGGHAFANPEFPLLSRLVFADDAESEQSLFAHEIARVRFPRTRVVVLAACSTAAGSVSRGEGVVSVARPFLGSGVPLVIASQWDVDDEPTEALTLAFHRELAKSRDPIRALQAAQLALLRSGDAIKALPANWGAFVAVGTATP